jgi:hypothetical protein
MIETDDLLPTSKGSGGWDDKTGPNSINKQLKRTCQFYALGKSESELLAYDEYDSRGSGRYFTDDAFMCDRFTMSEAEESTKQNSLKIFLVTISKNGNTHQVTVDEM